MNKGFKVVIGLLLSCFLLSSQNIFAQNDLGTIWQKNDYTTLESKFLNITKQTNGTYLASGSIIQDGRQRGYVVLFNEAGEKLNEWILTPPNLPQWTEGGNSATSQINFAYISSTGDLMAFGIVNNVNSTQKGHSLAGLPFAGNIYLKEGIWVTKVNKGSSLPSINKLDRGNSMITNALEYANDKYLIIGFDYQLSQSDGFLFRVYNVDGTWAYDNYTGGNNLQHNWVRGIFKLPNNNFVISSAYEVKEYDGTSFAFVKNYATTLQWNEGCVKEPTAAPATPGMVWTPSASWSMKQDGGFWASGRMGGVHNGTSWITYGSVFYEKAADNSVVECKVIQNESTAQTKVYSPPILLPGSTTDYVGTVTNSEVNYMYLCKDITPGGFTVTDGVQYPYNTVLNNTSHTDGFFSCGQDNVTKRAAIAKLSTCANFIATNVSDEYQPFANNVNFTRAINYQGAKGTGVSNVKYSLTAKVLKGVVNGISEGGTLNALSVTDMPVVTYVAGAGVAANINHNFSLVSTDSHAEVEYTLTIHDNYLTAGIPQFCNQTYIFKLVASNPSSTLFSDDVWFFGNNMGVSSEGAAITDLGEDFTSRGINFRNEGGVMVPYDYSKISKVNSWENSLSVSTPACDGSFIFYASHNMVYNTNHQPMKSSFGADGLFEGHQSTADGLASGYIGDNKYLLFGISTDLTSPAPRKLMYYIIDLNKNNGSGEISPGGTIETSGLSESIELLPKTGTYDEYWLVFFNIDDNAMKVFSVVRDNVSLHQTLDLSTVNPPSPSPNNQYFAVSIVANHTYDKIAMAFLLNKGNDVILFNFCPLAGSISINKAYPSESTDEKQKASIAAFSKNGKFLYVTTGGYGNQDGELRQYNLLTNNIKKKIYRSNVNLPRYEGGGIKMGPDGKMYLIQQSLNDIRVLDNPDLEFDASDPFGANFTLAVNGYGTRISTGLTPPWIDPPNTNIEPKAVKDAIITYDTLPVTVKPLLNDTDPDGNATDLLLTQLDLVKPADAALIEYSFLNEEVNIKPKYKSGLRKDTVQLRYIVKDKGTPIQLCDEGFINIYIMSLPQIIIKDSCSFNPQLSIDVRSDNYDIQWQSSTDEVTFIDVTGATNKNMTIKDDTAIMYYRAKVYNKGNTGSVIYSSNIKIAIESHSISNSIWYKVSKK